MLEMRPSCECCHQDLVPDEENAVICSFECTFCVTCNDAHLNGNCPNCGGQLVPRPTRAAALSDKFPVSTKRVESATLLAKHHAAD